MFIYINNTIGTNNTWATLYELRSQVLIFTGWAASPYHLIVGQPYLNFVHLGRHLDLVGFPRLTHPQMGPSPFVIFLCFVLFFLAYIHMYRWSREPTVAPNGDPIT